jgi:hypothetical protein
VAGDAFLDVVGSGTLPARRLPIRTRSSSSPAVGRIDRRFHPVEALAPLVAMLVAVGLVAATGLSRRSGWPEAAEPYVYGFFLDRYPLFAFALIYGAARIVAAAAGAGPAGPVRRVIFALLGLGLLALAGLYPTFGGLTLRGGFATGGMAFLTGQPLWVAYALGAAVAASMASGIVGAAALAANGSLRPRWRRIGRGTLAFLALWFAAGVIGLATFLGFGPWPARAMRLAEAGLATGLLLAGFLPHALLVALRRRT